MRKAEYTEEEIKEITKEIKFIQDYFGFKTKKLCEIMNIKESCFRNNFSNSNPTNYFKKSDLLNLKSGIKSIFKNYNHKI
jgi:hypothetical protein